jgi:alcohol dehydrogenase
MTMVMQAFTVVLAAFLLHRYIPVGIPKSIELWPAAASVNPETTMTAVAFAVHGNTSVLQLTADYPQPLLKPNQVLIQVHASSINPCDFKYRRNRVPNFILPKPKIPGQDVAGVVVRTGVSTTGPLFRPGDRVAAMLPLLGARWGAAATYVAVDTSLVAKIGPNTDFASAAAMPLVSLTVVQALESVEVVKERSSSTSSTPKTRILIQAGAGGVGTFAIQYAKHVLGMYVVATASAEKANFLRELGCDEVIDYRSVSFEEVARDFDVVLDPMSWLYESRTLGRDAKVLKPGGHYLNIFSSDWSWDNGVERGNGLTTFINWMYYKISHLMRPGTAPNYDIVLVSPNGKQLQTIMDLLDNSTIRAVVDRKFHLSDAAAAYEYLEQGHATGKVILYNNKEEEIIV